MDIFAPAALPTGLQHGTVTVGGGRGVEITTYRRDGDYLDNRHPDHVEFTASLEEDLARRDFTVNAMAMDLRGRLADPMEAVGIWLRECCGRWGSRSGGLRRTDCGSCAACALRPSWAFLWRRGQTGLCAAGRDFWPELPRSGCGRN